MTKKYDALALMSGGLDSILAARTVMDQGLSVLGLHFITPFFGKPEEIPFWQEHYGIEVAPVDISQKYVDMMLDGPSQGFGKWLNPCIDCKIVMLSHAASLLPEYGAKFLISGEVQGQRPMSQRADALNLISKRGRCVISCSVRSVPAICRRLPWRNPGWWIANVCTTSMGERKRQYEMAEHYGFTEIPTPAGGCCLTEAQGAARFVKLLTHRPRPSVNDFRLVRHGRQYWADTNWLVFGRASADNIQIDSCIEPTDYVLRLKDFPGPLAVGRPVAGDWDSETIRDAAAFVSSYSGKACKHFEATGEPIKITVQRDEAVEVIEVAPSREAVLPWTEPQPEIVREWKKAQAE